MQFFGEEHVFAVSTIKYLKLPNKSIFKFASGKRDGLSKEGSGRVAIYKTTGLIKSYTLESNYNMGKCVNVLPPKGKEQSCKVLNLIPPKFCPSLLEEVGRAMGPSILDLTNSNPSSRLINSEFRTLQGLRNALKNEISRGLSKARVNKVSFWFIVILILDCVHRRKGKSTARRK